MTYVALKPCRFAGQEFRIGDPIPGDLIHQGSAKNLIQMKIIARTGGVEAEQTVVIPAPALRIGIKTEEGILCLEPTEEGVQAVFSVLTSTTTEAEEIIKEMTDSDALILLHMSDGRKTIKAAAQERAKEIGAEESEGEQ